MQTIDNLKLQSDTPEEALIEVAGFLRTISAHARFVAKAVLPLPPWCNTIIDIANECERIAETAPYRLTITPEIIERCKAILTCGDELELESFRKAYFVHLKHLAILILDSAGVEKGDGR